MQNSKRLLNCVALSFGLLAFGGLVASAHAGAKVGAPAPAFKGTDSNGKAHELSQYKGKYVVLEWLNHGCPYVRKHYDSKNMQGVQKEWTGKGVVWLSVISSAKGKQGSGNSAEINAEAKENGSNANAILVDAGGAIGKAYGAQTTPHMYIINPKGELVYAGAIDDKPSTEQADVKGATNYISAALGSALAGKKIAVASTKSYGCGVHY